MSRRSVSASRVAHRASHPEPSAARVGALRSKVGESLTYVSSSGRASRVTLVKTHYDDAGEPYFTVRRSDGVEVQTDAAHISIPRWLSSSTCSATAKGVALRALRDASHS